MVARQKCCARPHARRAKRANLLLPHASALYQRPSGQVSDLRDGLGQKESQSSKQSAGVVGDRAAVQLSDYQRQLLGVKLTPVVKKPFVKTIRAYGYVVNDMDLYKAQLRYIEGLAQVCLVSPFPAGQG